MSKPVPPLLRKRRTKLAPLSKMPAPYETNLQQSVASYVRAYLKPGWLATAFPAGGKRSIATAKRLKDEGLEPGWPDYQFVGPDSRYYGLELKRKGTGRLSDDQKAFKAECEARDPPTPYAVAFDLHQALEILVSWDAIYVPAFGRGSNSFGVPTLGEGQ